MSVGYYILCLGLMLPLAAMTTFGVLLELWSKIGFWTTLGMALALLFDPLGDGIGVFASLLLLLALATLGVFQGARPIGFVFLAVMGLAASLFLCSAMPGGLRWSLIWLLAPSSAGVALSVYCALRSFRLVTA